MPGFRIPSFNPKIPKVVVPKATIPRATVPKLPKGGLWGDEERERITPATQAAVWKKRFGSAASGVCVCCKERPIYRDGGFVCGHRRAYASRGSNRVSNLEPICSRCNGKMGTKDLVPFCKKLREELKAKAKPKKKTTAKKPARKTATKKGKR